MKMKIRCVECGRPFETSTSSPDLFCSTGCQVIRDPIDNSLVPHRQHRSTHRKGIGEGERAAVHSPYPSSIGSLQLR